MPKDRGGGTESRSPLFLLRREVKSFGSSLLDACFCFSGSLSPPTILAVLFSGFVVIVCNMNETKSAVERGSTSFPSENGAIADDLTKKAIHGSGQLFGRAGEGGAVTLVVVVFAVVVVVVVPSTTRSLFLEVGGISDFGSLPEILSSCDGINIGETYLVLSSLTNFANLLS